MRLGFLSRQWVLPEHAVLELTPSMQMAATGGSSGLIQCKARGGVNGVSYSCAISHRYNRHAATGKKRWSSGLLM